MRLLNKRKTQVPNEISIYKNLELEKAVKSGKVDKYRVKYFTI